MHRLAHPGLSIAILCFCLMPVAEAGMNKCTNGKQITYTGEPCEKLGLNPAGPIKDSVTVMPIVPRPQKTTPELRDYGHRDDNDIPSNKAPRTDDSDADVSRSVTIKPVNPLVEKMLNW